MEQHEPIRELFDRYLHNQCSPEEVHLLLQYFNIPGNESALRGLVEDALNAPVENEAAMQPALDEAYANITRQIISQGRVKIFTRRFVQMAAAAAVVIVAIAWYMMRMQLNTHDSPSLHQLATAKGQRLQHRLPDGTVIWLAPGSLLQYPAQFTGTQREVTLKGEAFFEVAHDRAHPFIVHAGDMDTRVLGTSFTVQAYDDQPAVAVTLVTGKVNISVANQQLQLAPNQRAVLEKTTRQLTKQDEPDAAQMIARRDGLLAYKGASLQTVIRDIELSYNVHITAPAAIQTCTYYGQLDTRHAIAQVLQQIALTYNARLQQTNDKWEIVNGTCNN